MSIPLTPLGRIKAGASSKTPHHVWAHAVVGFALVQSSKDWLQAATLANDSAIPEIHRAAPIAHLATC